MRVCLAQYRSDPDVKTNLSRHREVVKRAAAVSCDVVLFPELSLTGYRPTIAEKEAIGEDSALFEPLQSDSTRFGIVITAGMPLIAEHGIEIGLLVYRPDRPVANYAKQILHADETRCFVPGDRCLDIEVAGCRVAPAICFEAMQPRHGLAALSRGASVYAATVAKPAADVERARAYLADFAERHAVSTLLVNAVGAGDEFVSGGRSAAWDATGKLIGELADDEGELIIEL